MPVVHKFFKAHGHKLFQLELGHSTGDLEKAWLTEVPGRWEGLSSSSSTLHLQLSSRAAASVNTDLFGHILTHPTRHVVPEPLQCRYGVELANARLDRSSCALTRAQWDRAHRRTGHGAPSRWGCRRVG